MFVLRVCADARAYRFRLLGGRVGRRVGEKHNTVRVVKKKNVGVEKRAVPSSSKCYYVLRWRDRRMALRGS